ncbi:zinc-finger-containing protein [Xanthomonas hortorum pv. hederae]|uniref:zinc-finger-containing protein n=1 Tax=Xanthomonas hortorum TaxID=56454 RepID=UPI0032E8A668
MHSEFDPWHPSSAAIARVKNALPAPTRHDCGGSVEIRSHREVFGRIYSNWPWVYFCTHCQARVGMHPFTDIPLGTLADEPTRNARTAAKTLFEQLWRRADSPLSRSAAYAWLASQLSLPMSACHFGLFDIATCERARLACRQYLEP